MDPIRSLQSYTLKLTPERVKEDLTTAKPSMLAAFEAKITALAEVQSQVTAILASQSVPTVCYPAYRSFANECWQLLQKFGGGTGLVNEVVLLQAKWKGRGCLEAVLIAIRDALTIPAPPTP